MPSITVAASWFRPTLLGLTFALGVAIPCSAQTLVVSAPNPSITIHPGDTNVPLAVTLTSSADDGPVTITLTGLPSGISVTPVTLSGGGSGTLQLSASVAADQEAFPPSILGGPNSSTTAITLIAFTPFAQATASIALTVSLTNPNFAPSPSNINLPIVNINTNGVPIIDKTTDVPGTITITSANGQTSYLPNSTDADNTATFHVHGNTTAAMPKLPYHISLNTNTDLLADMGLVCPYVKSTGVSTCDTSGTYILLANYDDKTLLRDWSASALANAIPSGGAYLAYPPGSPTPTGTSALSWWAPHSLFVELFVNGQYEGNYQLVEEVKVDTHRVDVTKMKDTDLSGKSLTGGYLVEIDARQTEDYVWITPQGVYLGLIDPDFTPEIPEQTSYIQAYADAAEAALFSSNYTDPVLGWRAYFDQTTAVNYYIVNDLMGNVDGGAFYSSDYFYKNENDPLLYMGPIWDFDISSGNVNYQPISSPTVPWMQTENPWYPQWFTDPGFKAAVVQQWNALKDGGVFSTWLASIPQEAATLQQSQINNFGRWPMQGIEVWPNSEAVGSYNGEVSYLTNWLTARMAYLDLLFNNKLLTSTSLTVPAGTPRTGTAAVLTAQVTGGNAASGTVNFTLNGIVLGVAQLTNMGVATLSISNLPAGSDVLQATYNGDAVNGLSISSPVTVTVLGPLLGTTINLASSTSSVVQGSSLTLSALVVANSGSTVPTGSVGFSSNGVSLGSASLSGAGTAILTTTALQVGNDVVLATYSGDISYGISASNSVAVTVTLPPAAAPVFSLAGGTYATPQMLTITDPSAGASLFYTLDGSTPTIASPLYAGPITIGFSQTVSAIAVGGSYSVSPVASAVYVIPPTFTIGATPAMQTIRGGGQSATFTVTIAPLYNFISTIAFSCTGPNPGLSCSFAPASLTPAGAPLATALTISSVEVAGLRKFSPPGLSRIGFALIFCLFTLSRRRFFRLFGALAILCCIGFSVAGCSSGISYSTTAVSVIASGGGVSQSMPVTVVAEY
jgi:hypothetical protein